MTLTAEQERLKQAYIQARGYWTPWTEGLLRLSPTFLDLYARYGGHPAAHGPLAARMCELIYVALDASSTHLFETGLRLHMELALRHGATPAEVMDVLAMATAQGLGGTLTGIGILAEELAAADPSPAAPEAALTAEQADLRAAWLARFGEWPRHCDLLLRMDAAYFALMLELMAYAPPGGGLAETERTLIRIALDGCFTGLNPAALRLDIRRALAQGIAPPAILQVLQMTAHLGVHACTIGVPALMALVDRAAGG